MIRSRVIDHGNTQDRWDIEFGIFLGHDIESISNLKIHFLILLTITEHKERSL